MTDENAAEIRALGLIFPSEILWEKLPDARVSLEEISAQVPNYRARFDFVRQFVNRPEARREEIQRHLVLLVEQSDIATLVGGLGLEEEAAGCLASICFALAGWQLTHRHQERLMQDYPTVSKCLSRLRKAARALEAELDELPRELANILSRAMPGDDGHVLDELAGQCRNLDLAFGRIGPVVTRRRLGAPEDRVLSTTVFHLMNAVESATGLKVETPRVAGERSRELRGPLRQFVLDYFELIHCHVREATLARLVSEHRRSAKVTGSGT